MNFLLKLPDGLFRTPLRTAVSRVTTTRQLLFASCEWLSCACERL